MARQRLSTLLRPPPAAPRIENIAPPSIRKGSSAEAIIAGMTTPHTSSGFASSYAWDKAQLVNAMTGWPYIGIKCAAQEVAGMQPQVAILHSGSEVTKMRRKAYMRGDREAIIDLECKFLTTAQKRKALAPVHYNVEVESAALDDDLVKLLERPNSYDNETAWSFFFKIIMNLDVFGEAFIWMVPNRMPAANGDGMQVAEMWVIPSHWVLPKAGVSELVESYEVRPMAGYATVDQMGWGWFPGARGKMVIPADQMIMMTYPGIRDMVSGMSPLHAGSLWVDCSNNIDGSRVMTFQNAMMPGAVLEIDPSIINPSEEEMIRIKDEFIAKYATVRRSGAPMLLSPGIQAKAVPWVNDEMKYVDSADQMKSHLLALMQVGQSVAGLVEETTFANTAGAKANFHSVKINPILLHLGQVFTHRVAKKFDVNKIIYWPDPTPDDPDQKLKRVIAFVQSDVMTVNEARKEYGYDPLPWGDKPRSQIVTDNSIPGGLDPEDDMFVPNDAAGTARVVMSVSQLQQQYANGQVTREAAIAVATYVLGVAAAEAEAMFDDSQPKTPPAVPGANGSANGTPQVGHNAPGRRNGDVAAKPPTAGREATLRTKQLVNRMKYLAPPSTNGKH